MDARAYDMFTGLLSTLTKRQASDTGMATQVGFSDFAALRVQRRSIH